MPDTYSALRKNKGRRKESGEGKKEGRKVDSIKHCDENVWLSKIDNWVKCEV